MDGETNLHRLLASIQPRLDSRIFVYCTLEDGDARDIPHVMRFREKEGVTIITSMETAEAMHLSYAYPCRMITLNVHSSLSAVGFLATILAKLAAAGVSVNPVSAFYHDHLFVPMESVETAMALLGEFGSG